MRAVLTLGVSLFLLAAVAKGQKPPLLLEKDVAALANELERETGEEEFGAELRRSPEAGGRKGSCCAELVAERLRASGLERLLE